MVAEHTTGKGFSGALKYQEQERKAPEERNFEKIEQQGVFGETKAIAQQMRYQSNERKRASKPVGHLVVSFPPKEKLSQEKELKAVKSVMREVNVDNTQYRIVKHNDKNHSHYHIVYNRVDNYGKLIDDHKIKDRLQVACSKTEREQGLQSHDKERTVIYDKEKGYKYQNQKDRNVYKESDKRKGVQERKEYVKNEVEKSLKEKPINLERFKASLKEKGIEVYPQSKNGKLSALSFEYEGNRVKASSINLKAKEVQSEIDKNKVQQIQKEPNSDPKQEIRNKYHQEMNKEKGFNQEQTKEDIREKYRREQAEKKERERDKGQDKGRERERGIER